MCLVAKSAATVDPRFFFVKFPSIVVVARGAVVPTLGISRPLGSHKADLWFSKQLKPFIAIASIWPVRNLHRRPDDLAPGSRE